MEKDNVVFSNFLNSRQKSLDIADSIKVKQVHIEQIPSPKLRKKTPELTSPLKLSNRSNNKLNQSHSTLKKLLSTFSFSKREIPSELKKTIQEFITVLKLSLRKKVPPSLSKQIFEILNDQCYFQENHIKNIIGSYRVLRYFCCFFIILNELTKCAFESQRFIIHPYKNYKIFWDLIHILLMIFLFFYLPLDIIFEFQSSKNLRIVLSMFSILDNFLGFSTAYFKHGKLITDRKLIFKSYIKNFIFDLVTQFSLIYDIFINGDDTDVKRKFIKLICLVQYRKFKQIYHTLIDCFKIDMKFGYLLDFINLIATSICIMHWVACAWYLLALTSGEAHTWLDIQNIGQKDRFHKYIYAFYWSSVTMMTVGYGDFAPQNVYETLFATIIVVVGCGLFAYYIK